MTDASKPYSFTHEFEELSLSTVEDGAVAFVLNIYAYGRAEIDYGASGAWAVSHIEVRGTDIDRWEHDRKIEERYIALDIHSILGTLIVAALLDNERARIDDAVSDRVAEMKYLARAAE